MHGKGGRAVNSKKIKIAILCGMLGCVLLGTGDWLMLYGEPTATGTLSWLTVGAAQIPDWRNALSMAVAFPATVLYGIGLFGIGAFLLEEKHRKTWWTMTAFGLTPWLCLHLLYVGILYLFAWLNGSLWSAAAQPAAEAFFAHFSWVILLCYPLMLPPYFYWAWQVFKGKSVCGWRW